MTDVLGSLIVLGVITATCSALWEWEADGKSPQGTGTITIILDGCDQPMGIVETTEVIFQKYNQVDAAFALAEGEGDLSLEYWHQTHRKFFARVLSRIGKEFSEEMPLVSVRFQLIYK